MALGLTRADMFTPRLDFAAMVSLVEAAPPNSSVHEALSGGWSREAHLLANMQEGSAGYSELSQRYDRPDMPQRQDSPWQADSMSWEELDAALEANYALGPSEEM